MKALQVGKRYQITVRDLTTCEPESWITADEVLEETPETVEILGFFIGEANESQYFAQAVCDGHYANLFIIPTGMISGVAEIFNDTE